MGLEQLKFKLKGNKGNLWSESKIQETKQYY